MYLKSEADVEKVMQYADGRYIENRLIKFARIHNPA